MNPSGIGKIQQLLAKHPEIAGSDSDKADSLNAMTRPGKVPFAEFQPAMMQMSCWGAIRLAAIKTTGPTPTPDAVLALCFVAIDLLTLYRGDTVDMALPAFTGAIGGLAQAGLVSAAEQTTILALAGNRQSLASEAGLPTVMPGDIAQALGTSQVFGGN